MKFIDWTIFDFLFSSSKSKKFLLPDKYAILNLIISSLFPDKEKENFIIYLKNKFNKYFKIINLIYKNKKLFNNEFNKALNKISKIETDIIIYPFFGFHKQILAKFSNYKNICNIFIFLENFLPNKYFYKSIYSIPNFILHEFFHFIQFKPNNIDIIDFIILEGSAITYSHIMMKNNYIYSLPVSEKEYKKFILNKKKFYKKIKKIKNKNTINIFRNGIIPEFYIFSAKIVYENIINNSFDINKLKEKEYYYLLYNIIKKILYY